MSLPTGFKPYLLVYSLVLFFLIMFEQALPEPVIFVWIAIGVLDVFKHLGIIKFKRSATALLQKRDEVARISLKPVPQSHKSVTHQGKVVAHGSAHYMFDEINRLSYYITLRSECGDKTLWGLDLKRVARETSLSVGDLISLEFTGRKAVLVKEPIVNNQGKIVGLRNVNTHRRDWSGQVLPS